MPVTTTTGILESTLTENKGFLQPTGFRIVINKGYYANLQYFAQSVMHPGATVNVVELPVRQITSVPLAGDKITYSELELTLILDEDMTGYKEMQSWLERTIETNTKGILETPVSSIYSDITVIVLSSQNNESVKIKYQDCIPTALSAIDLNATTGDVTYLTFNATFRFAQFEII
jgi:hypothetical protein